MLLRMLFSTRVPSTVIRIQTDASPFFSSLVFFKKKSTLNELLFIFPTVFSLDKSRKPTTFSWYAKHCKSARKALIRWRFLLHLLSPPFAPPRTVIFCRFLRACGKQKIPISLGNQDFTVFCFSSKWCHQESNLLLRFILIPWMTAHSCFIFYESHWISLTLNSLLFFINSTIIISLTPQR